MKTIRRLLAFLLSAALLLTPAGTALAAGPSPFALTVRVEGGREAQVRAFEESYPGNLYLSLADLSVALKGTQGQFRLDYTAENDSFSLTRGSAAGAVDAAPAAAARGVAPVLELRRNRLFVDGGERRYYTYRPAGKDLYMSLTDVQLVLDLSARRLDETSLVLDPAQPFAPDPAALEAAGYFDAFNAIVLGDADTGEILFYRSGRQAYPIASLSKLMSYLLLAEAAERGELSFEDMVRVPSQAAVISRSADGMVSLAEGASLPFSELLSAMLLASSNESAEALAVHAAGSTEAFVARMNSRAAELGLRSARFYTPHGLPVYTAEAVTAKLQNRMSAMDMFTLCAYLLAHYPQITDISSQLYATMPTLGFTTANTNPAVFNLPGVTGLKTGSTNRAGYCVAVSMPVSRGEETHDLVLVLLGAESAELRGQAAEILLRWAQAHYAEHAFRAEP